MSLSVVFAAGRFSLIQEPWVPGYLVSLALALSSYCLCHVQGVQLLLTLLFITPFPSLVFLENFGFVMLPVSSAPDSEWRSPLGRSPCLVSIFGLVSFYPSGWLERRLGSLPPVFSLFLFLWSLRHSEVNGWGVGMGLPVRLFLFQLWGCPASAVAVAGIRCSLLQARPFFGTVSLYLFKTLLFPSYAPRCRYDVPGVLALGSGLAASASCSACGRCLRVALDPGSGFPFVSPLWKGRLMG